jgi:hypothetical protein
MTFFDLRDAMLAADTNFFAGAHQTAITNAFAAHGLAGADPGQPGTVTATGLRTARLNPESGRRRLKNTFKQGAFIYAMLEYQTSSNLIPGYNLIPVEVNLTGPSADSMFLFQFPDEARAGSHDGLGGAAQALILTGNASPGNYTVTVRSRLGGSDQITSTQSANFKIVE